MAETPPLVLVAALFAAATAAAPAAEVDHAQAYRACMELVGRHPEEAFERASAWRALGGGDAADHCVAAALVGLKQYGEAARRFESLAQAIKAEPPVKADLLGHAAQAWLLDGKPARAHAVLTAALGLKPDDVELLEDRATALAAAGNHRDALADLDRVIERDPGRADAFAFRASAHRLLGSLVLAAADAERALALNRLHPEGLLERGIIRRLQGDDDGARRDWLAVLAAAPGSAAAGDAQANLERMDVRNP